MLLSYLLDRFNNTKSIKNNFYLNEQVRKNQKSSKSVIDCHD